MEREWLNSFLIISPCSCLVECSIHHWAQTERCWSWWATTRRDCLLTHSLERWLFACLLRWIFPFALLSLKFPDILNLSVLNLAERLFLIPFLSIFSRFSQFLPFLSLLSDSLSKPWYPMGGRQSPNYEATGTTPSHLHGTQAGPSLPLATRTRPVVSGTPAALALVLFAPCAATLEPSDLSDSALMAASLLLPSLLTSSTSSMWPLPLIAARRLTSSARSPGFPSLPMKLTLSLSVSGTAPMALFSSSTAAAPSLTSIPSSEPR